MLSRFFRALGRLSENTEALADTVGEANTQLRARLGLDAPEAAGPALLPPQLSGQDAEPASGGRKPRPKGAA